MFRKINNYFFGHDEVSLSDKVWFYGMYAFMGLALLFLLFVNVL